MKNNVKSPQEVVEISAHRWGMKWSEKAQSMLFGNNTEHVAIDLEPASIKALSLELSKAIHTHEAQHGLLWSEKNVCAAQQNDRNLFGLELPENKTLRCGFPTSNPAAETLYLSIRNLQFDGWERSVKMLPNTMLTERFLVGLPLSKIAPEDVLFLAHHLSAPQSFLEEIGAGISDACYLHIGFEQGTDSSIYKLYLEHPPTSNAPLYIGYKWNALDNRQLATTRYSRPETLSLSQLHANVRAAFSDEETAAEKVAHAIIAMAAARLPNEALDQLLFVEVTDTDSPRRSFDINLYESGLLVRDVRSQLADLAAAFAISGTTFDSLMQDITDDLLGHISGGLDRHGKPFLTVYYAKTE